jgi:hypothetical protein
MAMHAQRRLRVIKQVEAWLRNNGTPWFPTFLMAIFISVADFAMQKFTLEAKSVGPVSQYIFKKA